MPTIRSGGGNGHFEANVDEQNRLSVLAVQEPIDRHINEQSGKVWSIPFDGLDPAGASDYVVYIKNTGTIDLYVTDIRLSADTDVTQVQLHAVTGTAAGGSAITPVSRNVGSTATPTATIESGTDITGLTTAGTIFYMELPVVATLYHLKTTSNIIIPKDKAIALLVETATAVVTGIISLVEGHG